MRIVKMVVLLIAIALIALPGCSKEPRRETEQKPTRAALTAEEERFTISFDQLEPYWSSWKGYGVEGTLGLYCAKSDIGTVAGVILDSLQVISFDSRGRPVPPTTNGSTIFFETDGLQYEWINGVVFQTDGRLSFKVVDEQGLVHTSGSGVCILPDGRRIPLE